MDLYAVGIVAYATVAGFGAALPVVVVTGGVATPVPAVTGGAAFLVADFFLVKPILAVGNAGATIATAMTFVSETKSGATVIEKGQISTATKKQRHFNSRRIHCPRSNKFHSHSGCLFCE